MSKNTYSPTLMTVSIDSIYVQHSANARRFDEKMGYDDPKPQGEAAKTTDFRTIKKLADSIKQFGLMTPLTVRRIADDDERKDEGYFYELIAGFRRFSALEMLIATDGRDTAVDVNVYPESMDEKGIALANLVENVERKNLSAPELAEAVTRLAKDYEMSQSEIGRRLGFSKSYVGNLIAIRSNIAPTIWEQYAENPKIIAQNVLRKIAQCEDHAEQIEKFDLEIGRTPRDEKDEEDSFEAASEKPASEKPPKVRSRKELDRMATLLRRLSTEPSKVKLDKKSVDMMALTLAWAMDSETVPNGFKRFVNIVEQEDREAKEKAEAEKAAEKEAKKAEREAAKEAAKAAKEAAKAAKGAKGAKGAEGAEAG